MGSDLDLHQSRHPQEGSQVNNPCSQAVLTEFHLPPPPHFPLSFRGFIELVAATSQGDEIPLKRAPHFHSFLNETEILIRASTNI